MGVFGGDPRFVHYQVLYKILLWYDVVMIPSLLISQMKYFYRVDSLVLPIPMLVFEILRVILNSSHTYGNIPVYVAYLFVCFVTLILDIVTIVIVRATPFFIITMCGYAVFHILQLAFSVNVYRSFTFYQNAFYKFSQGQMKNNTYNKIDDNDGMLMVDVQNT